MPFAVHRHHHDGHTRQSVGDVEHPEALPVLQPNEQGLSEHRRVAVKRETAQPDQVEAVKASVLRADPADLCLLHDFRDDDLHCIIGRIEYQHCGVLSPTVREMCTQRDETKLGGDLEVLVMGSDCLIHLAH